MYSKVKIAGFPGWTLPQNSHVSVRLAPDQAAEPAVQHSQAIPPLHHRAA
jgi:hypothetical protein